MWRVFFDDSGTDGRSEIAVAACYISTQQGWDKFVKEWDRAREEEGFEAFHMAEFVAPREHRHDPWCNWDNDKKERVYNRLARVINANKWIGIASAVPKSAYDTVVPERIRIHHGKQHYTLAVRQCLMQIAKWRHECGISIPMKYVFDWEMQGTEKRLEIDSIWKTMHQSRQRVYGIEPGGMSFQHREIFKPLQAADILAWQMQSHMRKIFPLGHDDLDRTHPGFALLRMDQDMDLGFFTEEQLGKWVRDIDEHESAHGPIVKS